MRSSSESPNFQAFDHEIFGRGEQVVVIGHTPLRASVVQVAVQPQTVHAPDTGHMKSSHHSRHVADNNRPRKLGTKLVGLESKYGNNVSVFSSMICKRCKTELTAR